MTKILFALSFALSVAACASTPPPDATAASPQTSVEASPLTATPLDAACDQACDEAYETCLDSAASDVDACNCDNGRILCEHRCGHGGALHPCF